MRTRLLLVCPKYWIELGAGPEFPSAASPGGSVCGECVATLRLQRSRFSWLMEKFLKSESAVAWGRLVWRSVGADHSLGAAQRLAAGTGGQRRAFFRIA